MEIISSSFAIAVYFLMLLGPFAFAFALYRTKKRMDKETRRKRFGTLYEGLRKDREARMWYIPLVTVRNVFLILAIVFYRNNQFL